MRNCPICTNSGNINAIDHDKRLTRRMPCPVCLGGRIGTEGDDMDDEMELGEDEIEVVMPVSLVQKLVGALGTLGFSGAETQTQNAFENELFVLYMALSDVLVKLEIPPITVGTIDTIGKVNPHLN